MPPDFRADLVLLDANPLEDSCRLQQARAVVLRDRVFGRAALQALLDDFRDAPPLGVSATVTR